MPRAARSSEIVTFKADRSLLDALAGVPNRSEFIRNAVLAALQSVCPLCNGTGIMTPDQRRHWDAFARDHAVRECRDCHERYLVCGTGPAHAVHRR
ncbi:MAG: CopG family transcriptional regulator [Phycisphaerae bacterium]